VVDAVYGEQISKFMGSLEFESNPGARNEVFHRMRYQNLTCLGNRSNLSTDIYGTAANRVAL
jgi:hypothetical protein